MNRYQLRIGAARILPYLWIAFWIGYILLTEPPAYALFTLASTALHETGHLFAFLVCGEPLPVFTGRKFGLLLTPASGTLSVSKELMICAAGPAFNLLACVALVPALHAGVASEANFCFFALNLFTALFNLLPISGFDGGKILSAVLSLTCPARIANILSLTIAATSALFFYFFALFLTFVAGSGLYPFLLATFLLWSEGKRHPALWKDF